MPRDVARQRATQRHILAARRAAWLAEHGPCVKCGSADRLEVDHVDPSTKVTHAVWSWSKERREVELAKCQVLCCRCHKEKTAGERRRPLVHGTQAGYTRGCRCDRCREAHAACAREGKARKRAREGAAA